MAQHLKDTGDWSPKKECFVDGIFVPVKKQSALRRQNQARQEIKIMGIADSHDLPVHSAHSASPAEVKLVEQTLEEQIVAQCAGTVERLQRLRQ